MNTLIFSRSLIRVAVQVATSVFLVGAAIAQYAPPFPSAARSLSASVSGAIVVIGCGGGYIKTNTTSGVILETGVMPGLGIDRPATRLDGCLINNAEQIPTKSLILALTARDVFLDVNGQRRYSVVTYDAIGLVPKSRYDIPIAQTAIPKLILSSSGKTALVIYSARNQAQSSPVITAVRLDTLTLRAISARNIGDSEAAELQTAKTLIVDDNGDFQGAGRKIINVDLEYESRKTDFNVVSSYWRSKSHKDTGKIFDRNSNPKIVFADATVGTAVYIAGWDSKADQYPNGEIIVYDLATRSVISSFQTAYRLTQPDGMTATLNVHLSPKGDLVFIEQYEWTGSPGTGASNQLSRAKSGEIAAYDSRSGGFLGKAQIVPAPGQYGKLVSFSEDGKFLYYFSGARVHVVEINSMNVISSIALTPAFEPVAIISTQY